MLVFSYCSWKEKLCSKSILIEHIKFLLRYVCTVAQAKCTKESKNREKTRSKFCFKIILKKEQDSSSFFCWSVRGACVLQLACYKQGSNRTDRHSLWEKGREQNMNQPEWTQCKPSFDVIFSISPFSFACLERSANTPLRLRDKKLAPAIKK